MKKSYITLITSLIISSASAQFTLFDETQINTTSGPAIGSLPATEAPFNESYFYDLGGGLNVTVDYEYTPAVESYIGAFPTPASFLLNQSPNTDITVSPTGTTLRNYAEIKKTYTFNQAVETNIAYIGLGDFDVNGVADIRYSYNKISSDGILNATTSSSPNSLRGNGTNTIEAGLTDDTGYYNYFTILPTISDYLEVDAAAVSYGYPSALFSSSEKDGFDATINGTGTTFSLFTSSSWSTGSVPVSSQSIDVYNLSYRAIPEPSSGILGLMGMSILLLKRKR